MLLTLPPPVTNCHTFSDPLERDVLYGWPLIYDKIFKSPEKFQSADSEQLIWFLLGSFIAT